MVFVSIYLAAGMKSHNQSVNMHPFMGSYNRVNSIMLISRTWIQTSPCTHYPGYLSTLAGFDPNLLFTQVQSQLFPRM